MRKVIIILCVLIFLVGCTIKSTLKESCCNSCIEHYNPDNGQLCQNQDYSDGNIDRHCALEFEDEKFSINYCQDKSDDKQYYCETDDDCISTCGEGCVNKDWAKTYEYPCVNKRAWTCACTNNICYTDGNPPNKF